MQRSFFPKDGHFYKANLHCHSTVSDGCLSPAALKEAYLSAGYAAIAFTDHEVLVPHTDLTDDTFIALHGFETAVKERPNEHTGAFQKVYHLNLIAKEQGQMVQPFIYPENLTPGNCRAYLPFVQYKEELTYTYSPEGVNELIKKANAAGFLVTLNHPAWSMVAPAEYLQLCGLHGVEVFNTDCFAHGDCGGTPLSAFWRRGKHLIPIGGDDNHNRKGLYGSFSSFTMLAAREFSYAGLIEALENGWCYASNGPEILALWQEDDKLHVACSPAFAVILLSEGRYTDSVQGEGIEEAVFTLRPEKTGAFVRIEVVDCYGRRAIGPGISL